MSKQIDAKELAEVVTKLLVDPSSLPEKMAEPEYAIFMTRIAEVVAEHCGGSILHEASAFEGVWYVGVHGNECLPSDGGIWAPYDKEGELFDPDETPTKQTQWRVASPELSRQIDVAVQAGRIVTPKQGLGEWQFVATTLMNDEASSDEDIVAHFRNELGLSDDKARRCVALRQDFFMAMAPGGTSEEEVSAKLREILADGAGSAANVETKKVLITLAALTRVEYTEVLEVPADMDDDDLDRLVDQRYDDVDGGLYADDPDYWERGDSCGWQHEALDAAPNGKVTRDADGESFIVDAIGD